MAKRKPKRVHIECATPEGFRWFKRIASNAPDAGARQNEDGSFTITRADRFHEWLRAGECHITQQLDGARRRR